MKKIYIGFCLLLLIYMLWPSPNKISDFPALPNSDKSTLSGDTVQIPNVAAYFSDNFREFVVPFYREDFQKLSKLPFPPLTLNHPPEFSWTAIKKHTDSTYLEELVYPLRNSLYVNGFEPFYADKTPKFWGSTKFEVDHHSWYTKTTMRFYPANLIVKFLVWLGIVTSLWLIFKLGRKIII